MMPPRRDSSWLVIVLLLATAAVLFTGLLATMLRHTP
jgi:hypothetical protein